jgi:hypothetical protein
VTSGFPLGRQQNCFAERLIGSIRRECVDHIAVFGERHLRRILRSYALYHNEMRTHRSLRKDTPVSRPIHAIGRIVSHHAAANGCFTWLRFATTSVAFGSPLTARAIASLVAR